jgi:hypothetical protein
MIRLVKGYAVFPGSTGVTFFLGKVDMQQEEDKERAP